MTRLIRWGVAAALVFAAEQASAQAGTSPLPGSQNPSAPQAAAVPDNPAAAEIIQWVHDTNAKMIHVGKLGAERGTTTNVKEYGERIATEHERLDRELAQIAQKRSIPLQPAEQLAAAQDHVAAWQPVIAKTGLEFDRAYMDILVPERETRVAELKRLRDRTPGSDAELKGWLDEMEVLMEKTRNEARDVRQAVRQEQQQQQRQGRKP
jgi:putative membrane protein